jgi:hypothetical protein
LIAVPTAGLIAVQTNPGRSKLGGKKTAKGVSPQNVPWEDAIHRVLADADGSLHYTEIADRIVSEGLRRSVGATPAATVVAHLSGSLKEKTSPYLRVGRGEYTLKEKAVAASDNQVETTILENLDQETATGALRSFGMFWHRDLVFWTAGPKLLGRQGAGATDVNFAAQIGVYLLHDRERVIYVGRATDTLFARLRAHTADRLGGRWDRFSWCRYQWHTYRSSGSMESGRSGRDNGGIANRESGAAAKQKAGDNFSAIEYIQATDPHIETAKKNALIDELRRGAGL